MNQNTKSIRLDQVARHRLKGILMTMLGAFCFALGPVWVRSIEGYSATSIVFYRAVIGAIFLLFLTLRIPTIRQNADPRSLNRKQFLALCAVGLCMCGTATFYFFGVMHTTVAKAVLLHYTAPIYVAILGPFLLREKTTLLTWIAVGLGILGTVLIIEPGNLFKAEQNEILGIISSLLSGLSLAGVFLFGRYLAHSLPSMVRTLWGSIIVVVVLLPWGALIPAGLFLHNLPFLILLGTVSLAVPYTLFFKAHNYVSAQASSIAALFEPVCGIGLGIVIYSEHLSLWGILGAAGVLCGIYLTSCR